MKIEDSDLKIRVIGHTKLSHGGPKLATKVSVKHKPSGLKAVCDATNSQHKNKAICMAMIRAGLKA